MHLQLDTPFFLKKKKKKDFKDVLYLPEEELPKMCCEIHIFLIFPGTYTSSISSKWAKAPVDDG